MYQETARGSQKSCGALKRNKQNNFSTNFIRYFNPMKILLVNPRIVYPWLKQLHVLRVQEKVHFERMLILFLRHFMNHGMVITDMLP